MDWTQIGTNFGFAALCLTALSWAVWSGIRYAVRNIAEPIVKRVVTFIDGLDTKIDDQAKTMKESSEVLGVTMRNNAETLGQVSRSLGTIAEQGHGVLQFIEETGHREERMAEHLNARDALVIGHMEKIVEKIGSRIDQMAAKVEQSFISIKEVEKKVVVEAKGPVVIQQQRTGGSEGGTPP